MRARLPDKDRTASAILTWPFTALVHLSPDIATPHPEQGGSHERISQKYETTKTRRAICNRRSSRVVLGINSLSRETVEMPPVPRDRTLQSSVQTQANSLLILVVPIACLTPFAALDLQRSDRSPSDYIKRLSNLLCLASREKMAGDWKAHNLLPTLLA